MIAQATRLFAGARYVRFEHDVRARLDIANNLIEFIEDRNVVAWGAGPRIGLSGEWALAQWLGGAFSLIGSASGSVLFGETNVRELFVAVGGVQPSLRGWVP